VTREIDVDSNLVRHAHAELLRAGLWDEDSDYRGMLADAVFDLVKVFAEQGHSGFSASMARDLFAKLSDFQSLGPITDDPAEWIEVGPEMWQNSRMPSAFSTDGGRTHYLLDERRRWIPRRLILRTPAEKRHLVMYPRHKSQHSV
jgi:hypothetical protein